MKTLNCHTRRFESGLICLHSSDDGPQSVDAELREATRSGTFNFAIVFFSKACCDADNITGLMETGAPGLRYAACSTAGELTPNGLDEGQIVILLFPSGAFKLAATALATLRDGGMDRVVEQVRQFKTGFLTGNTGGTTFGLCLLDGASFMEEAITAAIHWGLDELPLLGGSAGDSLDFEQTTLILDGEIVADSAIFILVNTNLPTEIFQDRQFHPQRRKAGGHTLRTGPTDRT